MGQRRALIDSNVLIAAAAPEHAHHDASVRYFATVAHSDVTLPIHALSEFYNASTRAAKSGGTEYSPLAAHAALAGYVEDFAVLSLTIAQHLDALHRFAALGGTGPRVYDYLIGQVAVVHAIPLLVTWNVRHFQPLFPTLRVATPETLLQEQ